MLRLAALSRAALAALAVGSIACRPNADAKPSTTVAATSSSSTTKSAGGETVAGVADSMALRAAADSGRILGAPSAKVWMIMASDFQCPFCKRWHDDTFETVRKEYVDAGRVRLAYVNFPLDQHVQAMPAAEAAMCASAQGKFWPYHSALFRAQDTWGQAGDRSKYYDSLAVAVGADVAQFRRCTQSHVMRALINADKFRMERGGVSSTPSFFVGNYRVEGAQPLAVFRQAIDSALAHAR